MTPGGAPVNFLRPFRAHAREFRGFMAGKTLIGLDMGSRFIKALQLTAEGDIFKITEFGVAEVPSPEAEPDVLKGLLQRKRGFKGKRSALGVSGRSVFVRYVPMGVMSDQELVNAARYELGKYIPIEVDEVIHDCQKLEEPQPGATEMKVVLVAARRAYIDSKIAILESTDVYPNMIDVECFALANAYELTSSLTPGGAQDRTIAIVDLGASKSNVVMISKKACQFTREFYKGGDDLTDVLSKKLSMEPKDAESMKRQPDQNMDKIRSSIEDGIEDICQDVKISIDFFENQQENQVEEVLLTGGSANTPGMTEAMERMTQKPVRLWNPIEKMPMELDPESDAELKQYAFQSAIALGLAARVVG